MRSSRERTDEEAGLTSAGEDDFALLKRSFSPDLQLTRRLGEEEFGSLFLAREPALRRVVVVKVLRWRLAEDPAAQQRFRREAVAAGQMNHPSIMPIFRAGLLRDGRPFLVEPYVGECTLEERLTTLERFTPEDVRRILHDLASALATAHQHGFVHRGIHLGSVRCSNEGDRVFLTDFGFAGLLETSASYSESITPTGEILGRAGYISPEQLRGEHATERSDVYALGVLAWYLLAGASASLPMVASRTQVFWRDWAASVGDPSLVRLVRACLSQDPRRRPTATDILAALDEPIRQGGRGRGGLSDIWDLAADRRIPHTIVLFGAAAWGLLQVTDQLVQQALLPRLVYLLVLTTAIAGFPAALVVAWNHGEVGPQGITTRERWLLGVIGLGWIMACAIVWAAQ